MKPQNLTHVQLAWCRERIPAFADADRSVKAHWLVQARADTGQSVVGTLVMPAREWLSLRASLPANIEVYEGV